MESELDTSNPVYILKQVSPFIISSFDYQVPSFIIQKKPDETQKNLCNVENPNSS